MAVAPALFVEGNAHGFTIRANKPTEVIAIMAALPSAQSYVPQAGSLRFAKTDCRAEKRQLGHEKKEEMNRMRILANVPSEDAFPGSELPPVASEETDAQAGASLVAV